MDEKNSDVDKSDDPILPGFRFHPTDEELVSFYLKRKIQHKPLPIELIKQVDIYKYDPWDLPKLTTMGEKEWYFYCPRDRKYRNSARPNRVTGAGFWKATGTDRPIYSSDGAQCIGLKKSLVFYRGRAAKGLKTDWMMHEFRLPSQLDLNLPDKPVDKSFPANDSWAICRIFKKTNSMAQRALTQSMLSPSLYNQLGANSTHFGSENLSCTTEIGSSGTFRFCNNYELPQQASSSYLFPTLISDLSNTAFMGPLGETSMLVSKSSSECLNFEDGQKQNQGNGFFSTSYVEENMEEKMVRGEENDEECLRKNSFVVDQGNNQWTSMGFPFNLPLNDAWDSPPCPSEMSTNKCYI